MKNIITIAKNTFRETIRDRVLYVILAFALLFLLSTIFFGSISLGEDIKVVKDLGLAGIYIFSLIITIFLGTSLVFKEIEKRTLYILLSKPVSIKQFVIGKFLGLWASIILNVVLMTIVYLVVVAYKGGGFDYHSLWAILLSLFELGILIALTILFSAITTPLAGAIYSIIIIYIGHSLALLKNYVAKSGAFAKGLADIAYYLFPNLEKFNLRNSVVYSITPNSSQIIYPIVYAILFSTVLLWLATLALKQQDF
jgi:ABC-type transport system involved in multi-copper enzyme maturation permease subunit